MPTPKKCAIIISGCTSRHVMHRGILSRMPGVITRRKKAKSDNQGTLILFLVLALERCELEGAADAFIAVKGGRVHIH